MINKIIVISIIFFTVFSNAQTKAVTENGEEVILYKDNSWRFVNDSLNVVVEIIKNDEIFLKNSNSSFLVKSSKTNIGVWINPKEWNFIKAKTESPAELTFNNKDFEIYGMLLTEKTEIPVETLIGIAFENALEVSSDVQIIEKEYRNVNGLDVVMMKLKGTIQGVKFIYFGYYYSNSEGTYQFLTYTSQKLFDQNENEMLKLLNGLVEY